VVAHDRTLRDIARLAPRSEAELALAWGMGPTKLLRFGRALLDAVVAAV
jgi:ATP-dependent DNA helicase RecQ